MKDEQSKRQSTNRLAYYKPYPKQIEFHTAGALPVYERLFMAGNQLGKTWAGAFEVAMHATGRYPNGGKGGGSITASRSSQAQKAPSLRATACNDC